MFDHDRLAHEDFWRAHRRAFWRKVRAWLTGKRNELLPYEVVREHLPIRGQHEIGHQIVPIEKIIGSVGRYLDFDRAFLPTQTETTDRWVNIDKAHYQDIPLPPVELYKIGDVYFVRDGNHRVSVARERGQLFIDAVVTEIEVPIRVTADMEIDDLVRNREYALFMQATGLAWLRPEAELTVSVPEAYGRLHEHINAHRWYLGEERQAEVPYEEAVLSWYDNIYLPLIQIIQEHRLPRQFPKRTLTDLYLWVSEYQWLLREQYQTGGREEAAGPLIEIYNDQPVRKLVNRLQGAGWIEDLILEQERNAFLERTQLTTLRPEADIRLTEPGHYEKLLQHIDVHRWYLGEERGAEVSFSEAVSSWYDNVYSSLVNMIREQGFMEVWPQRTEADLYLWVLEHRELLEKADFHLPF